ncbi:MAG: glutamine-hydrolyzing GMP synthase, partial [Candidatus Aenigmarchaeota archaeon]|nr:glutamine-hydrolyzing GMP synthase [Candidatus Aenigmarchaeota archaeon]
PEVTHTKCGKKIFENFVFGVCKAKKDWSMQDFIERTVVSIKEQANGRRAVLGLSGGVDSSTVAALVGQALGKNLTAVFVDTGFMRKRESEFIKESFGKQDIDLKMIDAKKRFYSAMKGVEDPEKKRKIIGKMFIDVFNEEAKKAGAKILVQGTIYPDRIESGATKNSTVIKSHHNVGGLPKDMKLELMEPLQDLYKDEVRKVAETIGMPKELAWRHPFPGPGLAVRILGECAPDYVRILQDADYILLDELKKSGWYDKIWQAFAVLLPVKSVGVQGDARSYKSVIALRMVNSVDGMTADFSKVPHEVLEVISSRITNEVKEVGRVVYDITNKPPGTIEWE